MRIIQLLMARLKVWGQRAWLSTLRAFHLTVALAFFALAAFAGQKTFLAWQDYRQDPQSGLWMFYLWVGAVTLFIIFSLYSLLKARAIRS